MTDIQWGKFITEEFPRGFLIDINEAIHAHGKFAKEYAKALDVIERDRGRIIGNVRTSLIEKDMLRCAYSAGLTGSESGLIQETQIHLYQAHVRSKRAILVRAAIVQPSVLPNKNKSRKTLVEKLNRVVTQTRDMFDPVTHIINPIGVFLLICPDKRQEDGIKEVAIAIVDHLHDTLVFYKSITDVLELYEPAPVEFDKPVLAAKTSVAYQPPETQKRADDDQEHS